MTNEQFAIILESYLEIIERCCTEIEEDLKKIYLKDKYNEAERILSPLKNLVNKLSRQIIFLKNLNSG